MDAEWLRKLCLSFPGTTEQIQWGYDLLFKVGGKMFAITALEPVGNYAVRLLFDDRHDTGIYSWEYLHELGRKHESNWKTYLARLEQAGKSRDA